MVGYWKEGSGERGGQKWGGVGKGQEATKKLTSLTLGGSTRMPTREDLREGTKERDGTRDLL